MKQNEDDIYKIWNLPSIDDYHIHLREGNFMKSLVQQIPLGGCSRVLVMPNTLPPIQTCSDAKHYKNTLLRELPSNMDIEFLMTLVLGPWITSDDIIHNAKEAGVVGIKCYPKGVTTNSEQGVENLNLYYPLFKTMERENLSLHIHGEMPNYSPYTAEEAFMPYFEELATAFPHLKIVLEHVSTEKAVNIIKRLGPNVGATITAHHLDDVVLHESNLTSDNSFHSQSIIIDPHLYCKPIAKTQVDRDALREVIMNKHQRFFLGSDSAPHPKSAKVLKNNNQSLPAAGIFTSRYLIQYLADTFNNMGCTAKHLEGFACHYGADFFGFIRNEIRNPLERVILKQIPFKIPEELDMNGIPLIPYRHGEILSFSKI